jgi:hypothetical protein
VLPEYAAVRLYVPAASDVVENVATPEEFKVAVPNTVKPFKNLTVPVGEPAPPLFTVAVRLNACPAVTGFGVAARAVVVFDIT